MLAVLAFALLSLIAPPQAAAQQTATATVRGTVVESGTQRPLIGVQVYIKGTQRGGLTDTQGLFQIVQVPPGPATLRVESIGYRSAEQAVELVAGQTATVNIELQQSAVGLDEIIVTGTAGRTSKRALGNSIAKVNASELTESVPINNIQQLLQGRTAGVTFVAPAGVVGGSTRVRIRGNSSINAGNEPVVFVDGVRVQSGTFATGGNAMQGVNLLESFNPADIESVEVIKGPAAATLYGAEAAAGVVQIITKKGRPAEGLQWTANFEYGQVDWAVERIETYWLCTDAQVDDPARFPGCAAMFTKSQPLSERLLIDHPLDPKNRGEAVKRQYADKAAAAAAAGDAALAERWRTQDYPCLFPQQAPCNPNPLRVGDLRNLNMSVRGGGESYNFYISGEKSDENGTFYNNFNNRKSGRANFGFVPSPKANFTVNVGYSLLEQMTPPSDNSSNSVLRNSIRGQAGGPSSQYLPGFRNFHPEFSNKLQDLVSSERLTAGVTANYNPFGWWQNRLTVGIDRNDRNVSSFDQIDQTGLRPFGTNAALGQIDIDFDLFHFWTVDYAGTVTADLSENWASAFSGGMQLTKRRTRSHDISGTGLVANTLNLVSSAANRSAGQGFQEQTSLGFYVQEQVGWKDRLFATAAVRVDDNSAFGREFSLVVYPKASVSYVISDEEYFNIDWVDELKLRAAWGQAGNAPRPFVADRTYETGRAIVGDAAVNTLSTSAFGNPDLKAETGQEIELGFESSLLGGRLGAEFTFYYKQTKDALLSVSDPPSSGWDGTHLINVGEVRNSGLELSIDAQPVRMPNFEWNVIAALGTNSNKLISFGRDANGRPNLIEDRFGEFASVQRHREGFPLGGYWATDVVRDASGNVVLDAAGRATVVPCVWEPDDPDHAACEEEYVGPALPTRTLGLTNTFRLFDQLQLYVFTDYQGGHFQWCAICSVRTRIDRNTRAVNDPNISVTEAARLASLQTKEFIYKADFIKLREVALTYDLPQRFVARTGLSRAALTVAGRNLAIWTKYKGYENGGSEDPEVAFNSANNPGTSSFTQTDYAAIPMQRRWHVSLNFNF
jgi:TonB-linked SusC/RagA family outer membrane protein